MVTLIEPATSAVEVLDRHVTRRRIVPEQWPSSDLRLFPTSVRVSVKTPAGIVQRVDVRLRVRGDYIHAVADPNGRLHGEDEEASCEFPLCCELEAERKALERI